MHLWVWDLFSKLPSGSGLNWRCSPPPQYVLAVWALGLHAHSLLGGKSLQALFSEYPGLVASSDLGKSVSYDLGAVGFQHPLWRSVAISFHLASLSPDNALPVSRETRQSQVAEKVCVETVDMFASPRRDEGMEWKRSVQCEGSLRRKCA